jgi:protein SCO1/2
MPFTRALILSCLLSGFLSSALAQNNLPDDSIYQLQSHWQNQRGEPFALAYLAGKTQVISLIYTHCEHTCPTIIANMQAIQKALPDDLEDKVGFVLVSLTPDSDTPEVLAAFAQRRGLDAKHWTLLTGDQGDVRNLAMVLGVKYKPAADNEVSHSNLLSVIDAQGRLLFQELGLQSSADAVVQRIIQN